MSIFLTILLILAGIIVLLLVAGFFMSKDHYVKRGIIIHVPVQKAFEFLRYLKNQERFNKWAKADEERTVTHNGTDGTVGYIFAWTGNKKVGEGEKEIKNIIENKKVETEIRFVKPMAATASVIMETESLGANETQVYLINSGKFPYPFNVMIPLFQSRFAKDMDDSLQTLKKVLEEEAV